MVDLEIEAITFNLAAKELARITGRSISDVIKNEAAMILKKSVKDTGAASVARINARYDYKGNGQLAPKTIIPFVRIDGKRTRVRSILKRGKLVTTKKESYWDPNKINPLWRKLDAKLKAMKKYAKSNRGQSKATWIYIANLLKLKGVTFPGYVKKSLGLMPASLKRKLAGTEQGDVDYVITIKNAGSTAMAPKGNGGPGGFAAFNDALNGRRDYFIVNCAKGAFSTVKKTLAKYKGLKVEP